jgi:DNA invertase Pin-like site-specific DNA recombinase
MTTAVAYLRVSTVGQAEEGVSLEAQKAKIAAWCVLNDLELEAIYCDAGISGSKTSNRPELQKALDHVCKSQGSLVVYSLSRLARSTKNTIEIAERLSKANANLVSVSEKLDTSSAAGKMIFRLLAVMAEFEKDVVAERTKAALAHKKSKGERVGKVPVGFDLGADGVTLVPNEYQQEAIGLIRQLRQLGLSMREIAAELNARGIQAKHGGQWQHTTVQRILKRAS